MSKSTQRRTFRDRIAFVVIALALVAVVIVSTLKSRSINTAGLQKVVEGVRADATTLPADGRLLLGGNDIHLTEDGIAYVTGKPAEYILFADWRGAGTRLSGTLWSSHPLKPGDDVDLLVPRTLNADDPGSASTISPTTMKSVHVRTENSPGWYAVERNQD